MIPNLYATRQKPPPPAAISMIRSRKGMNRAVAMAMPSIPIDRKTPPSSHVRSAGARARIRFAMAIGKRTAVASTSEFGLEAADHV